VTRLFEDYGFLRSIDGAEIYFHRNSVLSPGFEALRVGAGVAFAEELGEKGPQASSVRIVDGRGHEPDEAARLAADVDLPPR
jgi:cold shock CspA family protein